MILIEIWSLSWEDLTDADLRKKEYLKDGDLRVEYDGIQT